MYEREGIAAITTTKKKAKPVVSPKLICMKYVGVVLTNWYSFTKLIPDMKNLPKDVMDKLTDPLLGRDMSTGKMNRDEIIRFVKYITKTKASEEEIENAIKESIVERPGMRYIVSQLKKKYKLMLYTGIPNDWYEYFNKKYGTSAMFDEIFIRRDNMIESDEEAVNRFNEKYPNIGANEILIIDNNPNSVEAAKQLGMSCILFKDEVQLATELRHDYKISFEEPKHIFRSYDIRGIYKLDLDENVMKRIGMAYAEYIGRGKTVCVGRDYRTGSDALQKAFMRGAITNGLNVIDIGVVPTPILYFTIIAKDLDGGVVITGSSNPAEWNGIKMCTHNAEMITEGRGMEQMKALFEQMPAKVYGKGKQTKINHIMKTYYGHAVRKIMLGDRKLKVVIDYGNGAWCGVAGDIFVMLGCEVFAINNTPDPNFSARGPNVTESSLEGLKKAVVENHADFGVGFDGDGDRALIVDDKGRAINTGSTLIPIFAMYYLKNRKGVKIVYDMPCSRAVENVVRLMDGIPIENRTGHNHIISRMIREGALIGGEYSNHIYFNENYCLDDGCFAALKMVEVLSNSKEKLSDMIDKIPRYASTPIESIYCPDELKFKVMDSVKNRLKAGKFDKVTESDGIKIYKGDNWILVRASNTMPEIKMNAEGIGSDEVDALMNATRNIIIEEISKFNTLPC